MAAATYDLNSPVQALDAESRSLADYVDILRRRRTLLLATLAVLLAIAVAVALLLPAVYRSTATILIKEQEIPQELVRSTVTSFADERIQVISQQVMTRATLLDLVDRYTLYGKARQRETSEEILDRMRRDIKLTPISAEVTDRRSGSSGKTTIAFTLSYDSEVPANAQKIANELTTLFLNENLKNRQQKAAETTSFLDEELARVTASIAEVEQQLAEFKRRHQGRTPDLGMANLVNSERAELEIQRLDRELLLLDDRKRTLEGQFAETKPLSPIAGSGVLEPDDRLRSLQSQLASLSGVYSDDHPDIRRLRREIASLQASTGLTAAAGDREQTLDSLRAQIGVLRQRYSDEHPDVVRLRRTYDALEQTVRAGAAAAPAALRPRPPDNPVFIALRSQIEGIAAQSEAMRAERKELLARRELLSTRLSQTPEVEREYLELTRDLDSERARFRELRDKQMRAQVAEQLERTSKAERFTIIDPPVFPEKPYRPNRPVILLMGVVLALFGGFVAVALREALDPTVHGPRDVIRVLQVPVLAVLPAVAAPQSLQRRRLRWGLALLALAVVCTAGATLGHLFVMPLDVAWFGALRRLGL